MNHSSKRTIYSSLTTPDGTVLVPRHRHDYVTHLDKNGNIYMIHGSNGCTRCSCNGDEKLFIVDTDDQFELIRKYLFWGTYGKDSKGKLDYVPLSGMSTEHITNVLANCLTESDLYYKYFRMELELRKNYK